MSERLKKILLIDLSWARHTCYVLALAEGGGMLKYILHLKEVLNGIEEDIDAECFEKIKNIVLKLEKEAREELENNTNVHD